MTRDEHTCRRALAVAALLAACSSGPSFPAPAAGPDAAASPPAAPAPALRIGSDAIAQRLARFIWRTDADDPLRTAVRAAAPASAAGVEALVPALLADARARVAIGDFYASWMKSDGITGVLKDPALAPEDSPMLRRAMADETRAFGAFVTLDGDHSYRTLMTAPFTIANAVLARFYGVDGVVGDELRRVALDPRQRAGLLTQPAWLAVQSSDVSPEASSRGYFILRQMLCVQAPVPPPGERGGDPPADTTNRQWILASTQEPDCQACHRLFDPIGFGLGNFDFLGRFSATEHGLPVDPSGSIEGMSFADQLGLAALLADTRKAQDCFAQQMLTFALGRQLTDGDAASLAAVQAQFAAASQDIQALIAAVAGSGAFLAP